MDFYVYIVLFLVVIVFITLLPMISGVATYKIEKPKPASRKGHDSTGLSKREKLKEKVNFTKDQNPFKFRLNTTASAFSAGKEFEVDSKTGLKRRIIGTFSNDPNEFDYDVEELIEEDVAETRKEEEARYQKFAGREQEENEALV
ncbi:LAFE_0E10440g1_1 [Lachancea fermentati]|uniref:LAFE_0E10440g1_1 n=1 Tax=Lachancea fermentati TaxID=4955 RepID=A0A1G4MDG9_LACFM|nr:LAFE_0E10440g1_1 [Lachancea fermentati]